MAKFNSVVEQLKSKDAIMVREVCISLSLPPPLPPAPPFFPPSLPPSLSPPPPSLSLQALEAH